MGGPYPGRWPGLGLKRAVGAGKPGRGRHWPQPRWDLPAVRGAAGGGKAGADWRRKIALRSWPRNATG